MCGTSLAHLCSSDQNKLGVDNRQSQNLFQKTVGADYIVVDRSRMRSRISSSTLKEQINENRRQGGSQNNFLSYYAFL